MSTRIRQILCLCVSVYGVFVTLTASSVSAQPFRQSNNNSFNIEPWTYLLLPSSYLDVICKDRILLIKSYNFSNSLHLAIEEGQYEEALVYADSLISIAKQQCIVGIRFPDNYENRAQILNALGRTREACLAYETALMVQDSVMRLEQSEAIRDMQASYELDRFALERAILTARNHKLMLISFSLLLLAAMVAVIFAWIGIRRTKRLQQELLLQMQQVRMSEDKKSEFINSMCHEVRTPLNCISGFSELLCNDDTTQDVFTSYSEIVQDNRRQLRYLFDDLLEVAYLETLTDSLPLRQANINNICRAQLRATRVRSRKVGVDCIDAIPTDVITLNTNEKYINLMLSALLNNASKFTQEGEIRIECGNHGDDHIFIAITDTGRGIAIENHEQIFERFYKINTFSPGNGLGLYLCRLIAKHLGGELHIDPTYTIGVRMVVTLPRK